MEKGDILVIGASNIDITGVPKKDLVERDSNPGDVHISPGGVGRNITENLARLVMNVGFITVLGEDSFGKRIRTGLEGLGIDLHAETVRRTPVYLAIHDAGKDMLLAVNDMEGFRALTRASLEKHEKRIKEAAIVVIEANLDVEAIDYVMKKARKVFVDAVSSARVKRLAPYLERIHTLKLNRGELATLTDMPVVDDASLREALRKLRKKGVFRIAVTMGEEGAILADEKGVRHFSALPVSVVNTTGAGDAFTAGLVYAEMTEKDPLAVGIALSSFSLETADRVHLELSEKKLAARLPSE